MSGGDQLSILVVLVCLVLGYAIVSLIIKGIVKLMRKANAPRALTQAAAPRDRNDQERQARHTLGVPYDASPAEVDAAYRALREKYDPAKVPPGDTEFFNLISDRLRRLEEAYAYLSRKWA
jgi:DnaJ-domain-containing protein 1